MNENAVNRNYTLSGGDVISLRNMLSENGNCLEKRCIL